MVRLMEIYVISLNIALYLLCTSVVHVTGYNWVYVSSFQVQKEAGLRVVSFFGHQSVENHLNTEKKSHHHVLYIC